jgi:hypothetical protein
MNSNINENNNDNDNDLNKENKKLDEKFLCKICFTIMNEPIELRECKHIFCISCLNNIFNSNKENT